MFSKKESFSTRLFDNLTFFLLPSDRFLYLIYWLLIILIIVNRLLIPRNSDRPQPKIN